MSNLTQTTYEYGANAAYIAEMYEKYLTDKNSVDASWQSYFKAFNDNAGQVKKDFKGGAWGKTRSKIIGVAEALDAKAPAKGGKEAAAPAKPSNNNVSQEALDAVRAQMLIRAYRVRGHLIADLDPLGLATRETHPELDISSYGFSDTDMGREITVGGWLGHDKLTLGQILAILQESYCNTFAVEVGHIQDRNKREWLQNRIESSLGKPTLTNEEKKEILSHLIQTVGFEEFLHKKYPGTKRFSSEGGDGLMPALYASTNRAAKLGVKEVVLGMPHRGRLNVLTAFMGKPYVAMLSEFNGNMAVPDSINSSGDVKYHQGYSNDRSFDGNMVHLSLTANPSHLEAVNPVVAGKVRAKQDQMKDTTHSQAMGILLHGDAAFCGQGIVAETLALSDLDAYKTGGTFHIVVNNQVGFTTSPSYGHKSPYPTDIAMMVQAPIFHINGDDPEAIVHASHISAEYRAEFKQDVVLDIWCYRKHGHNEGDEPRWTQPKMYKVIDEKPTTREVYGNRLIAEGVITAEEFDAMKQAFYDKLEEAYQGANSYKPEKADMLEGKWTGISISPEEAKKQRGNTGVDIKKLKEVGLKLTQLPENFTVHPGVKKVYENRKKMIETGENLDWAMGEALAFGTLLTEGKPIRFTGQDVIRGTFSHRHSGVWDQNSEEIYFSLNNIQPNQAKAQIANSNLSEFAVLGYEYGYSQAEPNALTLWEGQFGDFVNGAQTIIDQFITSAEIKWLRMSGLVMLLPHGYEGQGPEHSSARLERFLQQCAEDNIIVANCTTPSSYFHILRRQLHREFRKPLIMMSPKSLLRHKLAVSPLSEMGEGTTFHRTIGEIDALKEDKKIRKVLICSGKVYYDLLEARRERKIDDIAIVRMEQLYPFPASSLRDNISKYKNAEIFWVQEEPENMGAWTFVDRRIEKVLKDAGCKSTRPTYIGRPEAAATACGYMKVHKHQQEMLINEALS
jgi:2-oxoglutarate dehydrogenase E1 component